MHRIAVAVTLACLLAAAPQAAAMVVETPLVLEADNLQPRVGDVVTIDVTPKNDSVRATYATGTYTAAYNYDTEEEGATRIVPIGNVTLDGDAKGTFTWTVPADVKDKNVFVTLTDGDETLGTLHLAVENAPPIMFATGGAGEPEPTPLPEDDGERENVESNGRDVPLGLALTALAVAGVAAVARGRLR